MPCLKCCMRRDFGTTRRPGIGAIGRRHGVIRDSDEVRRSPQRTKTTFCFTVSCNGSPTVPWRRAQAAAKQAGMRIGLIADLAVGMSGAGSHAWTSQNDILGELEIGAPPDLYNRKGQNWGLTTFSPRALCDGGFAPFIATLRACLRHAGGVRIDHAMGLLRLWVVPRGADPNRRRLSQLSDRRFAALDRA